MDELGARPAPPCDLDYYLNSAKPQLAKIFQQAHTVVDNATARDYIEQLVEQFRWTAASESFEGRGQLM